MTATLLTRSDIEREIRVVELYRAEETIKSIGERVGLSVYYVKQVLARHGVQRRTRTEAREIIEAKRRGGPTCSRCEILLREAPKGERGLCGWCVMEGE